MSTSGGYHDECGGYHEYIGGCSVHWRDVMIHVGEQHDKILSISIENSHVLNIPRCTHFIPQCTHDIPPMYSWYPPDVLNISRCTEYTLYRAIQLLIYKGIHTFYRIREEGGSGRPTPCTEHLPMYSWYPSHVS